MKRARFNDAAAAKRALKRAGRWLRRAHRLDLDPRHHKPPGHIAELLDAMAKAASGRSV